jgi:hypothetical protein
MKKEAVQTCGECDYFAQSPYLKRAENDKGAAGICSVTGSRVRATQAFCSNRIQHTVWRSRWTPIGGKPKRRAKR